MQPIAFYNAYICDTIQLSKKSPYREIHVISSLPGRTKRGDGTVLQDCLWHGAISDVLPILPHVCHSSWRAAATAG